MSKTVTLTISFTTTGDGENYTDTYVVQNVAGAPQSRVPTFNGTVTGIQVPPGTRAVVIVVPAGSIITKTLKGANTGDTGIVLTPGATFQVIPLGPTATTLSLTANGVETLVFIWV